MFERTLPPLPALLLAGVCTGAPLLAQSAFAQETNSDVVARIRDEGLNHSQVMETLSYLTEVIGPRLTGSPNLKRANEWTRDKMACWGLTNAHLEPWGPFGRGWSLERFSLELLEPQALPLIAYPNAWSPGLEQPLTSEVVYLDTSTNTDLEQYKGKLAGLIVLNGAPRELRPHFEPLAIRMMDTNLLEMANAGETRTFSGLGPSPSARFASTGRRFLGTGSGSESSPGTNQTRTGRSPEFRRAGFASRNRNLSFLAKEKAGVVITPSMLGDGGTVFVSGASVPPPEDAPRGSFTNFPRPWQTNAPAIPPQITMAAEDYNRLVRMIQHGEKLKMTVDFAAKFHDQDLMAYDTIAEIPGQDLKDQLVMVGAHLDSWHAGTGATDNGAGVAAVMEAVRIIKALDLKPRRTIRVGLWSGEEQGLLGSRAYVARHFGYYTNTAEAGSLRSPKDGDSVQRTASSTNSASSRHLVRLREYEKLSAYFNLDNGGGKVRGVYLESDEAVRPLFRRWLEPFRDLQAETLTLSHTGGTDHTSFDAIGLPGFQFIQDPLDYSSRTHHSNEDVYDRIQPDDLKQASVILATFVYNAAMMDAMVPRKAVD